MIFHQCKLIDISLTSKLKSNPAMQNIIATRSDWQITIKNLVTLTRRVNGTPISEVTLVKVMVTFEAWSSIDMLLFVSWQSDYFQLRYSKFHIWPWKFKVKVMAKVNPYGPIWDLNFNWYVCFCFVAIGTPFLSISKQMSLPPFIFLEAIRHIRHFLIDKVFKETLWSLSNHTYGTHKCAGFWW